MLNSWRIAAPSGVPRRRRDCRYQMKAHRLIPEPTVQVFRCEFFFRSLWIFNVSDLKVLEWNTEMGNVVQTFLSFPSVGCPLSSNSAASRTPTDRKWGRMRSSIKPKSRLRSFEIPTAFFFFRELNFLLHWDLGDVFLDNWVSALTLRNIEPFIWNVFRIF